MYSWMFRHLPGPLWVRVLITLLALAAIVVVLFGWVFPAIAPYMPFNEATIEEEGDHAPARPGEGGEPGVEEPGQGG